MTSARIAFIGAGHMARALIAGLRAVQAAGSPLVASAPSRERLAALEHDFGISTCTDNARAAAGAGVVVLAVKPQQMRAACESIKGVLAGNALVLSVAAGVRIATLSGWLGGHARIIRGMPNRPALLGKGVTALFATDAVDGPGRASAEQIAAAAGRFVWVNEESQMDAVTALSGSGPAYFFLVMELLADSGRALGLPADVARTLSIETAFGAAAMARELKDSDLARLRAEVTSKGGTTEAALAVLAEADLRGIFLRAVSAAEQRAAELAAQL